MWIWSVNKNAMKTNLGWKIKNDESRERRLVKYG